MEFRTDHLNTGEKFLRALNSVGLCNKAIFNGSNSETKTVRQSNLTSELDLLEIPISENEQDSSGSKKEEFWKVHCWRLDLITITTFKNYVTQNTETNIYICREQAKKNPKYIQKKLTSQTIIFVKSPIANYGLFILSPFSALSVMKNMNLCKLIRLK